MPQAGCVRPPSHSKGSLALPQSYRDLLVGVDETCGEVGEQVVSILVGDAARRLAETAPVRGDDEQQAAERERDTRDDHPGGT
jgi:hypothetical protein